MKRVLVTGGSGRLGRYVVRALSDYFQVTIFDKKKPMTGFHSLETDDLKCMICCGHWMVVYRKNSISILVVIFVHFMAKNLIKTDNSLR